MIINADARHIPMKSGSVQCIVTSPPYYGLRDYGVAGQIGLETSLQEYIGAMVDVFAGIWDVLKDDGVVWLNLGDSYNGYPANVTMGEGLSAHNQHARHYKDSGYGLANKHLKPKDLMMVPHRVAIALQEWGWYIRQDIVWHKPNPMPESVTDRCTKAHEYVFLMTKNQKYYYNADAIRENASYDGRKDEQLKGSLKYSNGVHGQHPNTFAIQNSPRWIKDMDGNRVRNKRSVWTVPTHSFSQAHFATFPPDLVMPMILAGSRKGDIVLDPFCGSGTTGMVVRKMERKFIGLDLSLKYLEEFALPRSEGKQTKESINQLPLFNDV